MRNRTGFLMTSAIGSLLLALSVTSPAIAEKKSSDMPSMKQMMGECRQHHDKAYKAIHQMMRRMEEGQRSNDATKMRATLEASQNGLADLKQDMATCMNMMTMMDKMDSGMGGHMGEMGGMREGMEGMMERKSR